MTYGAEAVLPLQTSFPTLKTGTFTPSNNDELLGRSLDLIEEKREKNNDSIGLLPPETQAGVWCQRKTTAASAKRPDAEENFG